LFSIRVCFEQVIHVEKATKPRVSKATTYEYRKGDYDSVNSRAWIGVVNRVRGVTDDTYSVEVQRHRWSV